MSDEPLIELHVNGLPEIVLNKVRDGYSLDALSSDGNVTAHFHLRQGIVFDIIVWIENYVKNLNQTVFVGYIGFEITSVAPDKFIMMVGNDEAKVSLKVNGVEGLLAISDALKKLTSWTSENSNLIPTEILDYFLRSDETLLSSEFIRHIRQEIETDAQLIKFKVDKDIN